MSRISEEFYHLISYTCQHITSSYHPQSNGPVECQIELWMVAAENMQKKVRTGFSCYMAYSSLYALQSNKACKAKVKMNWTGPYTVVEVTALGGVINSRTNMGIL